MLKAGIRHRARVSRDRGRHAPLEYSEAVEKWAREHGGNATLKWLAAPMNCWAVILSYRIGDPRQSELSDGEPVLLHDYWSAKKWAKLKPDIAPRHTRSREIKPGSYAYELDELGVEGIIERLDRGNILSGRGQFRSSEHAAEEGRKTEQMRSEKRTADGQDNARHKAKDLRRSLYKIPFLPVGVELTKETETA